MRILHLVSMKHAETHKRFTCPVAKIALTSLLAVGAFQLGAALPAVVEAQAVMTDAPSRLSLNITGYEVQDGQIMVALYADGHKFDEEAKPFRDAKVRVSGPETSIVFNALPVGEFAFKIFHDENGNGELDTDLLGIPSEPYLFSNDASDPFSAPEWSESKFILPLGKMTRNLSFE